MEYVIIDVETTGGSPKTSKITEIALYKFDGQSIVDEFVTLVNPEEPIPDFIVKLTGISDRMVAEAPRFFEIAKQIVDFSSNCIFVAHNVSFDYNVIRGEFRRLGYDFRLPHLCTVRAARLILPGYESYSLGKITRALGIAINGRHRAGGDALATTHLFQLMFQTDSTKLSSLIQHELNPKLLHASLNLDVIDNIPSKTGVYFFYNEFNQLIYIGKSKSIKSRIEQHLRNTKNEKGVRMAQEIARVEFELTGSELIALLHESSLVKTHKPKYNRALKKDQYSYGLYDDIELNGYLRLHVKSTSKSSSFPIIQFSSKKEGNDFLEYLRSEFNLCEKYCGSRKVTHECFYNQIDACFGACKESEHFDAYNERVQKAIDQLTFERKSFYIVDKGREKYEKSLVLVESGVFKGFGFAPYHFNHLDPLQWNKFINIQSETNDDKTIINQALTKKPDLKIIEI
jgi:DNA polymerase-3 subunit epsilon